MAWPRSRVVAVISGSGRAGQYQVPSTRMCVPKTSSTSSDQAVFVDQATDTRLFPDVVLLEIDRFG